ncbi:MAG: aminotransferase class I/II-fold pyridoxal phosphate-dependent enzyme, partial [Planctomycetes bacterium]|nr:aminotransferase class I/II-fold pyridoxal phosphate-dependent enzyme [Planctomycetota bacterium]
MMKDEMSHFAFSSKVSRTTTPPINFLMDIAVAKKGTISLAAGLVDHETLPTDETNQLVNEIFSDRSAGQDALQYGTTNGLSELRREVLDYVCKLDGITPEEISVSPDNVVISSGSQQMLYIISDILINPGDIVITEWPSYFVYTGVLTSMGASVRAIEMDENGMITESLAETLEQLK